MKQYEYQIIEIEKLKPYEKNSRTHSTEQIKQIMDSIKAFGFTNPLLIDDDFNLIAGHGRLEAVKQLNKVDFAENPILEIPCIVVSGLSETEKKALVIADNKIALNAGWDIEVLGQELFELENANFDMSLTGFNAEELVELLGEFEDISVINKKNGQSINDNEWEEESFGSLRDRYIEPPFSVIDLRKKESIEKSREWRDRGIVVGGRGQNGGTFKAMNSLMKKTTGETKAVEIDESIFNPYLCEVLHHWFNVEKGKTIDPFAGGMERGFVASSLGHIYTGFDIRKEQIDFNKNNFKAHVENTPNWILDSSENILKYVEKESQDFCLSCPPYADLEVYSNDERDISNKEYPKFLELYRYIIQQVYLSLKENRFCAWVIGEVRGKDGAYYNFLGDTIKAFIDAGFKYYNEIVILTPAGTASLRANRYFKTRKLAKVHQNALIFYKGDIGKIKTEFKSYEFEINSDSK